MSRRTLTYYSCLRLIVTYLYDVMECNAKLQRNIATQHWVFMFGHKNNQGSKKESSPNLNASIVHVSSRLHIIKKLENICRIVMHETKAKKTKYLPGKYLVFVTDLSYSCKQQHLLYI